MTVTLIPFGLPAGTEAAINADSQPKGTNMSEGRATKIRDLNDAFRRTLEGGRTFFTPGVSALGPEFGLLAIAAVQQFDQFSADNDPYQEHDFGAFTIGDEKLFWKIDYYDLSMDFGSKNPADPGQTTRVLTILLAEEYESVAGGGGITTMKNDKGVVIKVNATSRGLRLTAAPSGVKIQLAK